MCSLGEVLTVIHNAARRRATVRARIVTWRRPSLEGRALVRHAEQRGGQLYASGREPPTWAAEGEVVHLWLDPPKRVREDRVASCGLHLSRGVRDDDRWWQVDAQGDIRSGIVNASESTGIGERFTWLLDAATLLGVVSFQPLGEGSVAGRATWRVRARPRNNAGAGRIVPLFGLGGVGVYDLDIDAERGVILRVEARIDEEPFVIREVVEIAFGEVFHASTFSMDP